jgi:hypothetical protein
MEHQLTSVERNYFSITGLNNTIFIREVKLQAEYKYAVTTGVLK